MSVTIESMFPRLLRKAGSLGVNMDDNETKVAILYGRIIVACLAILVALWQLDVPMPVV